MTTIQLSTTNKKMLVEKLKTYFEQELNHEIGDFDAEFLLDFFAKEIGCHYYNQALLDAQKVLQERFYLIDEAIEEITKPIP